jgi:hypothetical protein
MGPTSPLVGAGSCCTLQATNPQTLALATALCQLLVARFPNFLTASMRSPSHRRAG